VNSAAGINVNIDLSIDIATVVVTVTQALVVKGIVGVLADSLSISESSGPFVVKSLTSTAPLTPF
jgi:hypothetical protein